MGFLDNSTTTVDAILTTRGRELLSSGEGLNITKFALSDEEVDYTLFDVTHPNGTDSYGGGIAGAMARAQAQIDAANAEMSTSDNTNSLNRKR